MKRPRQHGKFNPKRALMEFALPTNHETLSALISYGGNPEHKKHPGDFGLHPPSAPRPDKSLCDACGITSKIEAERLLREGARRGLTSRVELNGFPKNIWAVAGGDVPLEAQLENSAIGRYHGYPMPEADPFRKQILEKWRLHGR